MNAPPEGSDTMRGGRVEKTPRSHVCGQKQWLFHNQTEHEQFGAEELVGSSV